MPRLLVIEIAMLALLVLSCRSKVDAPQVGHRIVIRDSEGRELSDDDLRKVSGKVPFELVGSNDVSTEAKQLHQRARSAGAQGNYEEALKLLAQARIAAPAWPYPAYDAAYTHLLKKDFAAALTAYEETLRLAPRGFFTAITAVHTLKREEAGELPPGTYLGYLMLEWLSNPEQQARAMRGLTEKQPSFAPAWFKLSTTLEDRSLKLNAIERGLGAEPDRETLGILLVNKAILLSDSGQRKAAIALLTETALDPDSTLAVEHMAKFTLKRMLELR